MPEKLSLLIRSGNPLISINTPDEPRAVERVRQVAERLEKPLFEWSVTTGLRQAQPPAIGAAVEAGKASEALRFVSESVSPALYLFRDLGPHTTKDPFVQRQLRDLAGVLDRRGAALILVDGDALPDQILRLTVPYEVGFPGPDEVEAVVNRSLDLAKREIQSGVQVKLDKREMEQLVQSLRGLTGDEASRVIASSIYDDHCLNAHDLPRVVDAKRTLLGSAGCLEAIVANVAADEIGGLDNLKSWLAKRRNGFSSKAREFGLEAPRGILLLGVQGCGKSLCAKVVAADWRMPLLRLDPGVLYQKYIGETENRLRQALRQAEAMAPVVLWIDEIEKAFASANSASADGGLSQRMFGTLLSWMQDHRHPIFLIATANNIEALPPELMRKGRFDEVFFVDLPTAPAREQILQVHLRRRGRDPKNYAIGKLAHAAEGFSGAEIEQGVIAGLFSAFQAEKELADEHILAELRSTRPLSVLMKERIAALREWARDRCVPAD